MSRLWLWNNTRNGGLDEVRLGLAHIVDEGRQLSDGVESASMIADRKMLIFSSAWYGLTKALRYLQLETLLGSSEILQADFASTKSFNFFLLAALSDRLSGL